MDNLYSFMLLDITEEKLGKCNYRVFSVLFCSSEGYLDFVSDAVVPEYIT